MTISWIGTEKGFYHTPEKGSSKPGKLKDVCSHGKCLNDEDKKFYDKFLSI